MDMPSPRPHTAYSMSPPAPPAKQHTRTYQACTACRTRKVKCDMGTVDAPHPPPCKRCKREGKDCVIAEERKKKRRNGSSTLGDEGELEDHVDHGRVRKMRPSTGRRFYGDSREGSISPNRMGSPPTAPAYASYYPTSANPSPPSNVIDSEDAIDRSNHIFKKEAYTGNDTMNMLVVAANLATESRQPSVIHSLPVQQAYRAWNRFRFVRSGLIKASEGIAYVQYFYNELAPFTPITIPNYSEVSTHPILLEHEPFLVMTILTISSRFMKLRGPGGRVSRPAQIHDKLWQYLRQMLQEVLLASQQFGGGLCGGGNSRRGTEDPLHRYGLRSISTVESLILLTEWHPRALHFPPGNDDAQLLVPENPNEEVNESNDKTRAINGTGTEHRDSWLEPSWRSNRMIWMLLNYAITLSTEIDILSPKTLEAFTELAMGVELDEIRSYYLRRSRLQEILWTFYVQTAGRLELYDKLPEDFLTSFHNPRANRRVQKAFELLKQGHEHNLLMSTYFDPTNATNHFWQEIAAIMKSGNETMFGGADRTRATISSGEYRTLIVAYTPLLDEWRDTFEKCSPPVPEPMRSILLIEYEYVRIYLHSLTLQAFVNRCVANTPSKQNAELSTSAFNTRTESMASNNGNSAVRPEDVRKWMKDDYQYVKKLVTACQHVLQIIGEGGIPASILKHLTVRTYFRVMTAAVFLLKSFVVGAYADDVARSLGLLKKVSETIRENIVDDVHIGNSFAEMIKSVSDRLLGRLVRFPGLPTAHASRAQSPFLGQSPVFSGGTNGQTDSASNPNHSLAYNYSVLDGVDHQKDFQTYIDILGHLETYDPNNSANLTVMPPPNFSPSQFDVFEFPSNSNGNGVNLSSDFSQGPEWIALNLTPLTDLAPGTDNQVSNTAYGASVNGYHVLDHLAQNTPFQMSAGQHIPVLPEMIYSHHPSTQNWEPHN